MSIIDKLRKEELKLVAEELGLVVPEGARVVEIKDLIEKSDIFSNVELVKGIVDYAIEEIKSKKEAEKSKLELEKIKLSQLERELEIAKVKKELGPNSEVERLKLLQLEKELEIANVRKETSQNNSTLNGSAETEAVNNNLENFIKSIKTLTIPVPSRAESFNLFFQSLERAFKTKNVPEEFKAEILLNLLGERANNLMIYVSEEDLLCYEKLKIIVSKEFEPTPQECLNNFRKAQKLPSENYVQFASRMSASFEYYCQLRGVSDFKSLCELIVSDKIFNSLDRELMTYIGVKQGESFFKPHQLGRECDIFLSSKGKTKVEGNLFMRGTGNENKKYGGTKVQDLRFQKRVSNVFLSEIKNTECVLCKNNESHGLYSCPQFKKLSINERVDVIKMNKLCFKCFLQNCNVKRCKAKNCFCGKPHNRLIHYPREEKISNARNEINQSDLSTGSRIQQSWSGNGSNFSPPNLGSVPPVVAASFAKNKTKSVLLSTARVYVRDRYLNWREVRCLLDGGSQACLITKECANKLQLKLNKINTVISCLNDSSMMINGCVNVTISNKDKSFERDLSMFVVNKITDLIPHKIFDVQVDIADSVPLADYSFNIPGKIDMLLGAEIFYELLRPGQIYAQNSQLILQNTVWGYVAGGCVNQINEEKIHCGLIREDDLNETLKKFWEIENVEVDLKKSNDYAICEEHFARTHFRNEKGKYVVSMPLKDNPSVLGQSRDIALKKLRSLWNRLSKDEEYLTLYKDFLEEYQNLGHMREVVEDKLPEYSYYAPHHGVYRPDKDSTKLRVVFNCSSSTSNGLSLNSLQYNGGVLQNDLFTIMIGFRQHVYAMTADVKMMYRMILIDPSQYSLQRILWCDSPDAIPRTFELMTVTYGTVSAPYLAQRTLKQLSIDEENNFPMAVPVLRDNFYMDDVLFGATTLEEAKEVQRQLIGIMKSGGMELHKWCANHVELSPNSSESYSFHDKLETKTLGVSWKPREDCFSFRVAAELSDSYTKRSVLSTIAKIFDPLGLLGPVIAKAKIFMQSLWLLKLDWNDKLPEPKYREWYDFLSALLHIKEIDVERRVVIEKADFIEIHGFSDASERGYGATVYAKSKDAHGNTMIKLVSSKSRVAPIKSLTIPRLELCAAVLLSKLVKRVLVALKVVINQVYFWTDSMIVLAWLQREPIDLKTFVQHRVAIIQELSSPHQWRHVPSDQNPADALSRGLDPDKLLHCKLWWNGPEFLHNDNYPSRTVTKIENCAEFEIELKNLRNINNDLNVFYITIIPFFKELIELSNNYIAVLRVLSFIFRFINNTRNPLFKEVGPLRPSDLHQAEIFLIRSMQKEEFPREIKSLEVNGMIDPKSKLRNLNPFLDGDGILRVGGRIGNSNFPYQKKYPAILPYSHKLTYIIIVYFHKKYLHIGITGLLNCVREKFWPLRGRAICRKVVHQCIACFKNKPLITAQLMGSLPRDRVTIDYPFNICGVDLCGPFTIKITSSRKPVYQKIYVCIFVCFVFKAVHLESLSDLTSESFLAALKRFVARRGKCAKLYSDNATNFIGANKELKKFYELIKKPNESLAGYLAAEGIDWKFIPPRAPNFGGLWEAAVKAFKYHFKRVVGCANLTYEQFLTIVVQIEGVLNSRPLGPLSTDETDFGVLTPAHFLINRSMNTIIEPDLTNINENRLGKWQRVTKIVQLIWRRWHRNYLSELQQRHKWRFEKDNVNIGDMVLLVEENLPTNKWPLGRIVEVYYGNDRKIRVVRVQTQNGIFKRSISKICLLPMPE